MKTLLEYLQQQKKQYKFRLKFSVPVTDEMVEKLETSLAKFEVLKVSNPKKTIIQGRPKDFVAAAPGEIYIVDAEFEYPATREAIADAVVNGLRIHASQIVVRTEDEPLETDREESEKSGKALLASEYEKFSNGELHSNDTLEKQHKEHESQEFEYAADSDVKPDAGPDFGTTDSAKSPMGSTKNKKPEAKSAAR
jgi:hypothetical protein